MFIPFLAARLTGRLYWCLTCGGVLTGCTGRLPRMDDDADDGSDDADHDADLPDNGLDELRTQMMIPLARFCRMCGGELTGCTGRR
jgi:hypothetical protein